MTRYWLLSLIFLMLCIVGFVDGQGNAVAPIPAPGIKISAEERDSLTKETEALGKEIEELKSTLKGNFLDLLPDVQIYYNAAHYALTYNEFYGANETSSAHKLLQQGQERAKALRNGKSPWATATGRVVRGYVSKIDDSVQPYGLVIPASYIPSDEHPTRLDLWYHGRGEKLTEISFLNDRQSKNGEFTPNNTIVLHLYGRYCNANHFAGEIDTLEALESVKKRYTIDDNRVLVRGFSMGGASTWNFAVHYTDMWAVAAPGAGFSESPKFLGMKTADIDAMPSWEKKLLHMYDCIDWAANLSNLPVVAYSGEIDKQKQAADIMSRAMEKEGLKLTHIIGPNTAHAYEKNAKVEVAKQVDELAAKGRNPIPQKIRFVTYTLRYPHMYWVHVDRMGQHWEEARVEAEIVDAHTVKATTKNVTALTLDVPKGSPLTSDDKLIVQLDGQEVPAGAVHSDHSWVAHFRKGAHGWSWLDALDTDDAKQLHKVPGLQGPIDDAFLDHFVMVKPTGTPLNEKVGKWTDSEMNHAITHWRKQFRGEALQKNDSDITDADIASSNLVLWGDPSSNKVLAKIADRLPISWTKDAVKLGDKSFAGDHHAVAMIFPNPLNPKKYVVLNSGFTFREYDYLNNARQIPKLPDYVVLDVDQPATPRRPAGIAEGGFFGENWELPALTK